MLDKHFAISLVCVTVCFTGGDAELFAVLFAKICSKSSSGKLHRKMLVQQYIALIQSNGKNEKPFQVYHWLLFLRACNSITNFEKICVHHYR
jgi:hypothetical protein